MTTHFLHTSRLGFLLFLVVILTVLLAACGTTETQSSLPVAIAATSVPQATRTAPNVVATIKTATSTSAKPTSTSAQVTASPAAASCGIAVDYGSEPLLDEIARADRIFLGEVTHIGDLVWNTADGKAPAKDCDSNYQQFAPVELTIREAYKGELTGGAKTTVFLAGAPGAKPFGSYGYEGGFPKFGEQWVWFLTENYNYRKDTLDNPLNYPTLFRLYKLQPNGTWKAIHSGNSFTLDELKKTVKDPGSYPTATPRPLTPTPVVKAGQTTNLVKLHRLDKATIIYLRSAKIPSNYSEIGLSDPRFRAILASLDKDVKVSPYQLPPPDTSNSAVVVGFIFNSSDFVAFTYDYKNATLSGTLPDKNNKVTVPIAPDFLKTLGLSN